MSFKHNGKTSHEWNKWLEKHRRELCGAGVPDAALQTELNWMRFLEEEGCDYDTGWSIDMLSHSQAHALHSFIQREYGNERYGAFLRELEMYLEKAQPEH